MDFGAFVRIGPGQRCRGLVMCPRSRRLESKNNQRSLGRDKVRVMIKEIDEKAASPLDKSCGP